jgi:hypothetical protein
MSNGFNIKVSKHDRNKSQGGFHSVYRNSSNYSGVNVSTQNATADAFYNAHNTSVSEEYRGSGSKNMPTEVRKKDGRKVKGAYGLQKAIIKVKSNKKNSKSIFDE